MTSHQLRHNSATLLLNAGAAMLTVQTILGHKHVDTPLGYARLNDGTVAAHHYRAMVHVESRLEIRGEEPSHPPRVCELLALVDSLMNGTLSEPQKAIAKALRAGIAGLAGEPARSDPVRLPL